MRGVDTVRHGHREGQAVLSEHAGHAIHTMLGSLFELADERSGGELGSRLRETAEEIAAWLPPPQREPSRFV